MSEENKHSVSSTVFSSWERFKGGLRRGPPEWSAQVVVDERPVRGVLEEIGQEGSLVENSGLVVPKPRYPPPLRPASVPSTFSPNLVTRCPKSLPKGDRRACSLSINNTNGIFPFPSDAGPAESPPASVYELAEFLRKDHPPSRNAPETWVPCPQIPRNNPIIPYFQEIAPRPKIPHLVNVTEQPRDSTAGGFPSERGWWNYFYRGGGGASSHATAQNPGETTIRAPELALPPMGDDRWSMDVEAANTPHTPLTEKALKKHQRLLRYKAKISKLRAGLRVAWGKFVDCVLLIACAIWWFISGCGCGLFC